MNRIWLALFCCLLMPHSSMQAAIGATATEPRIKSIHGKVVTVVIPAGFATVKLQVLTSPLKGKGLAGKRAAVPEWKTVASRLTHGEAGTVQLKLAKLTGRKYVRVLGVQPDSIPASLLTGVSTFAPDVQTDSLNTTNSKTAGGEMSLDGSLSAAPSVAGGDTARTVTESDIWKIDGDRLYFFNSYRGLQVIDIAHPDDPALLGTLRLAGAGEDMYLLDAKHVVLLKNESYWWWWADWDYRWNVGVLLPLNASPITLNLVAEPRAVSAAIGVASSTAKTSDPHAVVVVDVGNGKPVQVAAVGFEGDLQESRMVGSVLYVASNVYDGQAGDIPEWGCRVTSFDLADPEHPVLRSSVRLGGWAGAVYASDRHFFVAEYGSDTSPVKILDISDPTGVIKEAGEVAVRGYVQDKFKMHEEGDTLTVVSSDWNASALGNWAPTSIVSTFSLATAAHEALGSLVVAPGENLYATRFDGKRLYLVTAVQSFDPLHIIDLSDPAHPTVQGLVEVPGFSTFIQPLGTRLVTTGLVNWKPTVSLYDVSDAAHPTKLSSVTLGGNSWASSEATWDEKAFNVLPDDKLILMPISDYDSNAGYASGVQILDLLADKVVKRGVITGGLYPRRATVHRDRILSLSSTNLISVDAKDRDHPVTTANIEISWSVDRVFLAGNYLLELGNGDYWANNAGSLNVAKAASPDEVVATLPLSNFPIVGATLRDGVLYLLQADQGAYWNGTTNNGTALTISAIDASHLPAVKLLGSSTVKQNLGSYLSSAKPLWVNERTLIFSSEGGRSWGWPIYFGTTDTGGGVVNTLAASDTATTTLTLAPSNLLIRPWYPYWIWTRSRDLLAFDVTDPTHPKFASELNFGADQNWDVAEPFAANDSVYLGFKVLPIWGKVTPTPDDAAGDSPDDTGSANRYYLKLIDYSDSAAPVATQSKINIPGELRGLSRQGHLLYTVGPALKLATGEADAAAGVSLQTSGFDGSVSHLLDQLPLSQRYEPFAISGETVFLLEAEPAQVWQVTDEKTGLGEYDANPKSSVLRAYTVQDDGKFLELAHVDLEHELAFSVLNDLAVVRGDNRSVRLLNVGDPAKPIDLGVFDLQILGSPSLENAAGNASRGLWLPVGAYGVEALLLPQAQ